MRTFFTALLLFPVLGSTLCAQIRDDSSVISTNRKTGLVSSIGEETLLKEAWGGRVFFSFGPDYLQFSPFSWSFVHDPRDGRLKCSINPLLTIAALPALRLTNRSYSYFKVGHERWLWCLFFLLPQSLTNLSFHLPVVRYAFYLNAGQRTDFYLLNDVARIYTEGYAGMRLTGGSNFPLALDVRYAWPISQGFLENKRPYLGIGVSLMRFEELPPPQDSPIDW